MTNKIIKIDKNKKLEDSIAEHFFLDDATLVKRLSIGVKESNSGELNFEHGARIVIVGYEDVRREFEMDNEDNWPYKKMSSEEIDTDRYIHIDGQAYATKKGPVFVVNDIEKLSREDYNDYLNI